MLSIPLHITHALPQEKSSIPSNPLPKLLNTPSGLAILEIQGTIHTTSDAQRNSDDHESGSYDSIGRLEFPLYGGNTDSDLKWMKKVYLYVGKHQRLTGEVRKLATPLGVIGKRIDGTSVSTTKPTLTSVGEGGGEELEILDVVRYKIVFSSRPEPIGADIDMGT